MSKWTKEDITDFVRYHRAILNKSFPELTLPELIVKILQLLAEQQITIHFDGLPIRGGSRNEEHLSRGWFSGNTYYNLGE